MKKAMTVALAVVALLAITTIPALAVPPLSLLDRVDLGNIGSEAGHHLYGWGPIEKLTHGGGWGGIADDGTRVVWYSDLDGSRSCISQDPNGNAGTLTLNNKGLPKELRMRVLDGIADDSFEVYVEKPFWGGWVKIGSYTADPSTTEIWKEHVFELKGIIRWLPTLRVKILATGMKWASWCPYGQLAVDWVEVWGWPSCSGRCK